MTSLLRVPRGGGSDFSTIMRAGRSDRKNKRSASWMASARSWVTNSVVTFVRIVRATSSLRSRAATLLATPLGTDVGYEPRDVSPEEAVVLARRILGLYTEVMGGL
jgi:hypothetical protein